MWQRSILQVTRITQRCHFLPNRLFSELKHEQPLPSFRHHKGRWPISDFVLTKNPPGPLPARTIPDEHLSFTFHARFFPGTSVYYSHFKMHPGDMKVRMQVSLDHLNLNEKELAVLRVMMGSRINIGKRVLTLTSDIFTNRVENRKYLTFQLETILLEVRKLAKEV